MKNKYGLKWIFSKTKGLRPQLALFTFLVLLSSATEISIAYFLKLFMDIATGESELSLLTVGVLSVAVIAVTGVFAMLISVLSKYIYGKTERNLRSELMSVIFSRRMTEIAKQHTGELQTKLTVDAQAVSECFPVIIKNLVGSAASVVIATVGMFILNWKMALIMLVLTPLGNREGYI